MKTREFIGEAEWAGKKEYVPQVGDDVRVKGDKHGQTLAGKVLRIGRSGLYQVKLANGETVALPANEIACRDMSCKNYADFRWNKEEPIMKETHDDEDRFPEYMGGYKPPFTAYPHHGTVMDANDNIVLECENTKFSKVVEIALNQYVRNN